MGFVPAEYENDSHHIAEYDLKVAIQTWSTAREVLLYQSWKQEIDTNLQLGLDTEKVYLDLRLILIRKDQL